MVKIKPLTYRDLMQVYGDPGTREGKKKINDSQVSVKLPFPLYYGEKKIEKISCHEYCSKAYVDALKEILETYTLKYIKKYRLNEYGGCHVFRQTVNGKWWSIHSWGMAFDHNMKLGPYGPPSIMPYHFVNAFLKRGFGWGGNWIGFQDGMHFSVTGT